MAVEKIPSNISGEYTHLFEIGNRLEESQSLEVDEILLQVCSKDREIQFGRKVAHLNSRILSQDAQTTASNEKANTLRQTLGVYLEGTAVVCHIVSAVFGGASNPAGGAFSALGQAFTASATYRDKVMRAKEETLNHSYQRTRDIVSDHTQQMQSAEKEHEQDANTIERMIQNSRRQAEMIAGQ